MGILQKLEIMGDTREANCRPASKLPFIVGACTAFLSFFLCTGRSVGLEWVAWIGEITPEISFVGYALTLPSSLFLHWWPLDLLICDLWEKGGGQELIWGGLSLRGWLYLSISFAVLFVFYALFTWGGIRVVRAIRIRLRSGQAVCSRQLAVFVILLLLVVVASWHLLRREVGSYQVNAYVLPLEGLPRALEGFRLVFFTDVHIGFYSSSKNLERAIQLINELEPDVIMGGGDYVLGSSAYYCDLTKWLGQLRPRVALVGVLGNHDHSQGRERAATSCEAGGMIMLDNKRIFFDKTGKKCDSEPEEGFCLAGVGDLGSGDCNFRKALGDVSTKMPCLVLCHNPDAVLEAYPGGENLRIDCMLTGHTHGGQMILPWGKPVGISTRYPDRFLCGWAKGTPYRVYISKGLGESVVPFRVGATPEIALFVLKSKGSGK